MNMKRRRRKKEKEEDGGRGFLYSSGSTLAPTRRRSDFRGMKSRDASARSSLEGEQVSEH
jgi:hypothetical protein